MMQSFPSKRIPMVYSIPAPRDSEHDPGQSVNLRPIQSSQEEISCLQHSFFKWINVRFWRRWLLGMLPLISIAATMLVLVLYNSLSPAFSFIYIAGSVEIPNLTYTSDLTDPKSQKFIMQAETIQNYFAELYESSTLGKYYLTSVVATFSEGDDGLRAYYWNTFWAPQEVVYTFKKLTSLKQREILSKHALQSANSSDESFPMAEDFDLLTMDLFVSDSSDYDVTLKSVSFDLYAKPGNNRTLTLMNPKKSFYQWRLRVPSNYIVRLVVLTLHGVTPGSCASHRLSAYDFLLPLQSKIITRWCGVPEAWSSPIIRLTSSSNVMLVTFSLDRRKESNMLKAYFQAVPKVDCGGRYISWNGTVSSPYYPSYYPPNIDCSWLIRAPLPGYKLSLKILVIQIQEKSLGANKCDKDWLEIDGVRYCKAIAERNKEYGYSVAINFHSDELVTYRGFYIEYKAFSHMNPCPRQFKCMDRTCIPLNNQCDGWKDCFDGSDELDCGASKAGSGPGPSGPLRGPDSCGEDSDENECPYKSCSSPAYKCLNGKCLTKPNPECDGIRDCGDGSDEMNCACGRSQLKKSRIVGGEDARSGKWPWQASLQMGMHGHICGASVVSNRWLLSAAHCFLDSDSIRYSVPSGWKAYMGIQIINKSSNHVAMRSIKRIIVHPRYDHYISDYDIALLEMETPVFFSELVQPICLPRSPRVFFYGTVCYVTGWGALKENSYLAKTLQEAKVKIINQSVCNKLYDDLITSRMLCAGNLNGGIDACQGDSGGPLACAGKGNRWYLAGIVSWGEGCARRNRPGVYTKEQSELKVKVSPWNHLCCVFITRNGQMGLDEVMMDWNL
ncbi:LOW QUALITY PROTEIN: suppressor of tumorigenicity 14 protein homolog [Carettochelys insculpta]|uniref:LOW QUALITY PROTEIN: suppressor of tumorigenicity 14 protein homolog n=1 Tax=Carettochelys insculpta TaxID=44489 RepID=UPI003EB9C08C